MLTVPVAVSGEGPGTPSCWTRIGLPPTSPRQVGLRCDTTFHHVGQARRISRFAGCGMRDKRTAGNRRGGQDDPCPPIAFEELERLSRTYVVQPDQRREASRAVRLPERGRRLNRPTVTGSQARQSRGRHLIPFVDPPDPSHGPNRPAGLFEPDPVAGRHLAMGRAAHPAQTAFDGFSASQQSREIIPLQDRQVVQDARFDDSTTFKRYVIIGRWSLVGTKIVIYYHSHFNRHTIQTCMLNRQFNRKEEHTHGRSTSY